MLVITFFAALVALVTATGILTPTGAAWRTPADTVTRIISAGSILFLAAHAVLSQGGLL